MILVVGVGAARGVTAAEVGALIDEALRQAGPSPVRCVATVEGKDTEPGIVQAARERGWPLVACPAADLAEVAVPSPSAAVLAATGTASVAEAAAQYVARGLGDAVLLVRKIKSPRATAAVAGISVISCAGRGEHGDR